MLNVIPLIVKFVEDEEIIKYTLIIHFVKSESACEWLARVKLYVDFQENMCH